MSLFQASGTPKPDCREQSEEYGQPQPAHLPHGHLRLAVSARPTLHDLEGLAKSKSKKGMHFCKCAKNSCRREHATLPRISKTLGIMQKNHLKNTPGHSILRYVNQLTVNEQSSKKKSEKGSNVADTWPLFAVGYIIFLF